MSSLYAHKNESDAKEKCARKLIAIRVTFEYLTAVKIYVEFNNENCKEKLIRLIFVTIRL
jgi:hypothetical protein